MGYVRDLLRVEQMAKRDELAASLSIKSNSAKHRGFRSRKLLRSIFLQAPGLQRVENDGVVRSAADVALNKALDPFLKMTLK